VLALQKALLRERDPAVSGAPATVDFRGMLQKLTGWRDGK
jgi:hypothetical protein